MSSVEFTLSYMLRNSGDVLSTAEHTDVRLARRDGSDLHVGTVRREAAIRDSLDIAARALGAVLDQPELATPALAAMESALPWISWLDVEDRQEFAIDFTRMAQACHATENYEPLARLIHRWRASAEIAQTPELAHLLAEARGADERVPLAGPVAQP